MWSRRAGTWPSTDQRDGAWPGVGERLAWPWLVRPSAWPGGSWQVGGALARGDARWRSRGRAARGDARCRSRGRAFGAGTDRRCRRGWVELRWRGGVALETVLPFPRANASVPGAAGAVPGRQAVPGAARRVPAAAGRRSRGRRPPFPVRVWQGFCRNTVPAARLAGAPERHIALRIRQWLESKSRCPRWASRSPRARSPSG
mgnify:CR=1 FL=1